MTRQSITINQPNEEWLKSQLSSNEFFSKSELINHLIREARKHESELEWIRAKLENSEKSGFTSETAEEILAKVLTK